MGVKTFYVEKTRGPSAHSTPFTVTAVTTARPSRAACLCSATHFSPVSLTCNHANQEGRCFHFWNPALAFPRLSDRGAQPYSFVCFSSFTRLYVWISLRLYGIDNLFRWHYIVMLLPFTPPSQISILISAYQGAHSHSLVHKSLKAGVLKA